MENHIKKRGAFAPRNITAPRIDLCILLIAPRPLLTSLPNYPFPLPIRHIFHPINLSPNEQPTGNLHILLP